MRFVHASMTVLTALVIAACGGEDGDASTGGADAANGAGAASQTDGEDSGGGADADTILAEFGEPYVNADLEAGRREFRRCQTCHTLREDDRHMVGPNLHGIFDRRVGEAEGFRYSDALVEADFEWTPEELDQWLANPRDFLPGNRMSFAGLREEEDRVNLIAYLAVETAE